MNRELTTVERARLLSDVLEDLIAALKQSLPFESLHEARCDLQLLVNALQQKAALPAADQDPEVCRGLLVGLAVICLKAVCNLYPPGRAEKEAQFCEQGDGAARVSANHQGDSGPGKYKPHADTPARRPESGAA